MVGLALWYIVADIYIRSAVFSVCACVCVCVCVYVVLNIRCTGIMFTKMHSTASPNILQCCALRQGSYLLQPFVIKGVFLKRSFVLTDQSDAGYTKTCLSTVIWLVSFVFFFPQCDRHCACDLMLLLANETLSYCVMWGQRAARTHHQRHFLAITIAILVYTVTQVIFTSIYIYIIIIIFFFSEHGSTHFDHYHLQYYKCLNGGGCYWSVNLEHLVLRE